MLEVEEGEQLYREIRSALDEGRLAEAIPELERYLAEFRDDWEVRLELGHALFRTGELERARDELSRLAGAEGADPRVHRALGAVLGSLGEHRDELAAYRKGGEETPEVLFNQGLQAFERRDAGALKRLVGKLSGASEAKALHGWLEALQGEERGDWEAALSGYRSAREAGDTGWYLAYNAARAALELGRPRECLEELDQARAASGESLWEFDLIQGMAHLALEEAGAGENALRSAMEQAPSGEVLPAYNLGVFLLESGRPERAAAILARAAGDAPEDRELRLALARAHFSAGRFEEAAEVYTRVVEEDPQHFRAQYNLAYSLEREGRDEEAREVYQRALKLRPAHYKTMNKLGRLHLKAKEADKALRMAERSLGQEHEENAEGYLLLGQALKGLLRFSEAARALEEAGRREPKNLGLWKDLAFCQRQTEQAAAAKESAKKAYALAPRDTDVLLELGLAYLELAGDSDLKKSRKAFQDALELSPGSGKALAGLAQVSVKADPPEEALRAAKKAVEAKGGYRAFAALGDAYRKAGKPKKAIDAYKHCLSRNKGYWPACDGIAAAYEALGVMDKREKYRKLAVKLRERRESVGEGEVTGISTMMSQVSSGVDPNPGGA